jgi:hypothetical protein
MTDVVPHLRAFTVSDDRVARTRNGMSTRIDEAEFGDGEPLRMIGPGGVLIAIGYYDANQNSVQPKVVLV